MSNIALRASYLEHNANSRLSRRLLLAALLLAVLPLPAAYFSAQLAKAHAGALHSLPCSASSPCPFYIHGLRAREVTRLP